MGIGNTYGMFFTGKCGHLLKVCSSLTFVHDAAWATNHHELSRKSYASF
jgi:hypothetical protein